VCLMEHLFTSIIVSVLHLTYLRESKQQIKNRK
jgi:hypothetical protein